MIAAWLLPLLALGYVGLLFAVAYKGDRRGQAASAGRLQPFIYALSLGVYCTSWTFYGAVGTAATGGFAFLPIYLGPILVFTVGFDFLQRVVRISKARNATSIADLLALRYGKSRAVAVLVTLLAVAGGVPYIALQLKAVTVSMEVLGAAPVTSEPFVALLVAGGLALFAILFGTRELDATEHHRGMMWAIALESVVKLVAFVAIGIFALATLGGLAKTGEVIAESQDLTRRMALLPLPDGFITSTLLAMAAIICLPRQFHVAAVEYRDRRDLRTARWLFPLYLVIFSMFVIPIAVAGLSVLPENVSPDTFVLALPAAGDHQVLSLLAFIGGFSAATSMVIVATVALATMVSNDIVLPVLLRRRTRERADVAGPLLQARRTVIVLIALASWGYFLIGGTSAALASIGLLAFAAVAQFAPALVLGVYWSGATRNGALAGLIGGGVVWLYALLLPVLVGADSRFVVDGLLGISWLRPQALFGFDGLSPLSHGALWSLGLNIVLIVLVSRLGGQSLGERMEALAFTDRAQLSQARAATQAPATLSDLQELAARFVGRSHARTAFAEHADEIGWGGDAEATANAQSLQFTERLLSGSIGAASARSVLSGALQRVGVGTVDAARLLNATSQVVRFNRQLLESTLNSISQAVSVVDENLDLVGWNQAYVDLFDYPTGMVHLGQPIDVLLEENGRRGLLGEGDTDALISLRLKAMDRGEAHTEQRVWPDGRVIEVQGRPMPGGGYVTTYTDVTPYKRAEEAVRASEEQVRLYTDNAPAMLTYIDADRRLRFANRAYLEFVGSDRDAVLGQQL
ncbi:MAG: PAS-domain containing protein, partial [Pseudomonadota bacterium]